MYQFLSTFKIDLLVEYFSVYMHIICTEVLHDKECLFTLWLVARHMATKIYCSGISVVLNKVYTRSMEILYLATRMTYKNNNIRHFHYIRRLVVFAGTDANSFGCVRCLLAFLTDFRKRERLAIRMFLR